MEKYRFSEQELCWMEGARAPFAVYQFIDRRVVTLALSAGFCDLFGYSDRRQAYHDMDNDMYREVHPDDTARVADAAFHFATEGGRYETIYRTRRGGPGEYRLIHAQGEHFLTDTGVRLAQIWYTDEGPYTPAAGSDAQDLNDRLSHALHRESLLRASYYDYLTGLPSMTYFFELAEAGRRAVLERGGLPALLFLDLSGMKFFNHKHGFARGDALLRDFAKVLAERFSNENCSRLGQDHFAVFTQQAGLEDALKLLFADARGLNEGKSLPVRVGIYLDRSGTTDISVACDRAKFACDAGRNVYASGFNYFSDDMQVDADRRQYIIDNLKNALDQQWVQVFYQPIVRAANGRVCDEEALARWIDPEEGMLSPAEFIPVLEEAGLIHRLDLYMVDQVLAKLKDQEAAGLYLVPQSVNLSRVDFDACDIVEEVRRRVDDAGVGRDKLNIEITESVIGSDFDFMKRQVERFRELGFQVWMDDFGSGYSSLDVLQSIRFDLIKFDMRFMQQLDSGEAGRIILTELVRMALGLGLETVCEGVERADQAAFLQEIGCSKLQGYYYCKPIPMSAILERYAQGRQIGMENPRESAYYEAVGRINLYDVSAVANDEDAYRRYFDTQPMAILEVQDGRSRYVRCNRAYSDFMQRHFHGVTPGMQTDPDAAAREGGKGVVRAILRCGETGERAVLDEDLSDRSTAHVFIRRVALNPVTGAAAVALAVLAVVKEDANGATYAKIARALATDYRNLYYVNLEDESFIEYTSGAASQDLAVERHGEDFFNASRRDAIQALYSEDVAYFTEAFTRENILRALDAEGAFTLTYRLLVDGEPVYVNMKATRMQADASHIIIGVSNVDRDMKQKAEMTRIRQEEITWSRITALAGDYICIYTVDPETCDYTEYSATRDYEGLGLAKSGVDFFGRAHLEGERTICPEDREMFRTQFTRENVMREIERNGLYVLQYRLMINGEPVYVHVRAALSRESDGPRLIIGVNNVDAQVRRE